MAIRILVAIGHANMRESIQALLEKQTDMELLDWDMRLASDFLHRPIPDVLLMDIDIPWLKGIEMIRQIVLGTPEIKLLALSIYANRQLADETIRAGASGYLLKDQAYEELFPAIRTVAAGSIYKSPRIEHGYFNTGSSAPGLPAGAKK